jgi:RNA polymerase sigma-70 factor (ECF subfamily)
MRAWAHLNGSAVRQRIDPPRAGRPRDTGTPVPPDESEQLDKPGFAEEALPWLDAVHRFALRLTRDASEAEDLVQETFLRAYRSWERYERGTSCRSWLFTICRHTYLHERQSARARYEMSETDVLGQSNEADLSFLNRHARTADSPEDFFNKVIDDELVAAIDALPEEFREVLIMSDLGDLAYPEIADVLAIPVGTVKSRLFRGRRQVRNALVRGRNKSEYVRRQSGKERSSQ